MPLILFYSTSNNTNYVKTTAVDTALPNYNMGIILSSHVVDSNNITTDMDVIGYPSNINIYQTNLNIISVNSSFVTDLKNSITNSTYGLTFNINDKLASMPNNLYSSLLTDSLLFVNDTNNTIYDSQYTPSSIWVNNLQTQTINSPSSYMNLAPLPTIAPNIETSGSWLDMPNVILTLSPVYAGESFTCSWSIINAPTGSYIFISGDAVQKTATTGSITVSSLAYPMGNTYSITASLYSASGVILNTTLQQFTVLPNHATINLTIPSTIYNNMSFAASWTTSNSTYAPSGSYIRISNTAGQTVDSTNYTFTGSSTYTYTGQTAGNTYSITASLYSASGVLLSNVTQSYTALSIGSQIAYTTPGTYSWVAPTGVTSVSVVAVGSGGSGYGTLSGGGGGGGLGWRNNIPVTPGQSYTVVIGDSSSASYFISTGTVCGFFGGNYGGGYIGVGGGTGGDGGYSLTGGGGGAGGYSGTGGRGGYTGVVTGTSGAGGGGGGGGHAQSYSGGGGGGVGIFGQGSNGSGGSYGSPNGYCGVGGSYSTSYVISSGGLYGGGGGGDGNGGMGGGSGGGGAVRLIWLNPNVPVGVIRAFPSTNTADM